MRFLGLLTKIKEKLNPKKLDKNETIMKKYDIIKIFKDEGAVKRVPENGVSAPSVAHLKRIYAMCGEDIEIVREYGDDTPAEPIAPSKTIAVKEQTIQSIPPSPTPHPDPIAVSKPIVADQPYTYFKIGNIECRTKNGVVEQKQWVATTEIENYRILSVKTNKIITMNDKILEVLKWVPIETNS